MVYMQPRANMSPVGRQPFRPGQWQGFKGVSKNTTYVQNNFFGGAYGNYYDSAMNYNCGGNCGGPSKFEKWMMGLGVGTTLLGGILSLFKKDKSSEGGGLVDPPADNKQQDEIDKLKKRIAELEAAQRQPATPTPTPTPTTPAPTPTPDPEPKVNPYKDFGKNGMVCRDEGGTRNITGASGQVNITKPGAQGQPPQEFTITDTTENGSGNTYTYKLTGQTSDGKPIYSCTSKNGQPISKGNQYIYENGQLVQKNGMEGSGRGLKTDAENVAPAPTAAPASAATAQSTQSVTGTPEAAPATEKEKTNANNSGVSVANDLVGYTNDEEKGRARTNISNTEAKTITDFLKGYKDNKGLGDDIITQINTEYGWTNAEKLESQKQILQAVLKRAEDEGIKIPEENLKYCNNFMNSSNTTKVDNVAARNIDSIINQVLKQIDEKQASNK